MQFWIMALIWAPFTFLLHNVIHELSHAIIAVKNGATIVKFWPFPGKQLGYFTWAYVSYRDLEKETPMLPLAPVITELILSTVFLLAFLFTPHWIRGIFLAEVVSANVDITTWLLGYWRNPVNPACDAEQFRKQTDMSLGYGKMFLLLQALHVFGLATLIIVNLK